MHSQLRTAGCLTLIKHRYPVKQLRKNKRGSVLAMQARGNAIAMRLSPNLPHMPPPGLINAVGPQAGPGAGAFL